MTKEVSKRELDLLRPVKLIASENPKKPGSMSYDRFNAYFECERKYPDGYTIKDAYKEGVRGDDIRHDLAHGFIIVGEEEIEEWEKSKPREMVADDL